MQKTVIMFIFIHTIFSSLEADHPIEQTVGYISIGIQIGKGPAGHYFWGSQFTLAKRIHIAKIQTSAWIFPGICCGFRRFEKQTSFYLDGQLSIWSIVAGGAGIGIISGRDKLKNSTSYTTRTKFWAGIGFIPCLLTYDRYRFSDQPIQEFKGVFINPLIVPIVDPNFNP